MAYVTPVYKIEFWSGPTLLHGFGIGYTNKIKSFRVHPGLTTAIGSFEIVISDTGSNASGTFTGTAFANIEVYSTVKIWFGYTGSGLSLPSSPQFMGKIDSKQVNFSNEGYIRTFIGRDFGEALFRTLERRGFTGSAYNTIVTLKDDAGLDSSNTYISATGNIYPLTLVNDNCFNGLKEVVDFDNRDFYVDTGSRLQAFERQSIISSQTILEGTDILSYRLFKDLTEVYNQYYVFGMRDPADFTGSDLPANHNDWTETSTGSWTGWIKSGSGPAEGTSVTLTLDATDAKTGSYCIQLASNVGDVTDDTAEFYMLKVVSGSGPSGYIKLNDNDFLHIYSNHRYNVVGVSVLTPVIRLETNSTNYFECKLEAETQIAVANGDLMERKILVGPSYEGVSATGSNNTFTGSYKWTRIGNPDWYKIGYFRLYATQSPWSLITNYLKYNVDGLYFGTRFQYETGSPTSSDSYGFRPKVVMDDKYTSNQYCTNVGATLLAENSTLTTQIELITFGVEDLVVGTLYPISIFSENILAYYDLIDLEYILDDTGLTARCLFTNKKQLRTPIPLINYPVQVVKKEFNLRDEYRGWFHRG